MEANEEWRFRSAILNSFAKHEKTAALFKEMRSKRHDVRASRPIGVRPATVKAWAFDLSEEWCAYTLAALRWPEGVITCPCCRKCKVIYPITEKSTTNWKCKDCDRGFSVTVGTIFQYTRNLRTWIGAQLLNQNGGVGSTDLGRRLGMTQANAWLLLRSLKVAQKLADAGASAHQTKRDQKPPGNANASARSTSNAKTLGPLLRKATWHEGKLKLSGELMTKGGFSTREVQDLYKSLFCLLQVPFVEFERELDTLKESKK